jgi:hypothetical protein
VERGGGRSAQPLGGAFCATMAHPAWNPAFAVDIAIYQFFLNLQNKTQTTKEII